MTISTVLAVTLIAVVILGFLVRTIRAWWFYRGDRIVTCPENHRPAGVSLPATKLAAKSLLGKPPLDLSSCSRWPEKAGCGKECLAQLEESPEDCLVRTMLLRWYAGKSCAACGQPFGEIPLTGAKPAVLRADMSSVDWTEIPAEELSATLETSSPICFACHLGNTLVRQHPELVVNRNRPVHKS